MGHLPGRSRSLPLVYGVILNCNGMNTPNVGAQSPFGQQSPWVVYNYEVWMVRETSQALSPDGQRPQWLQNAVVESMLLHTRILVDILLSRGEPDDIKLSVLLPTFKSPLIEKLREAYGNRSTVGSPCFVLNKRLAHPTMLRSDSYGHDYKSTLDVLVPIMNPLIVEVAQTRQATIS
jgi:hypothetical protein